MVIRQVGALRLICVAAMAVTLTGTAAAAASTAGAAPPTAAGPVTAGPPHTLGTGGWKVASSATATQTGRRSPRPASVPSGWLPVRNDDAGAPGTEIEALLQNGACPGDTALQPVNQTPAARTASSSRTTCSCASGT